jgi:hypothetical protein
MVCEDAPDPTLVTEDARHPVRIRRNGHDVVGMHEPHVADYRDYNRRVVQRSGLVTGLFDRGEFRSNMTTFWTQRRKHSEAEINVMETVGAILELCAARLP